MSRESANRSAIDGGRHVLVTGALGDIGGAVVIALARRGHHVTGSTGVPSFVPIDSVRYAFNGVSGPERRANFITRWTDPAASADYYRMLLTTTREPNDSEGDYLITDQVFNG